MRIEPGHGYWDTTHYPIGGSFKRAGDDGKEIQEVIRRFASRCKGCDIEVRFTDGSTGACRDPHVSRELIS